MNTTHGKSGTRIHRIWWGMIARCDYPCLKSYKDYGGRGITYDPRWRAFVEFDKDMGLSYRDGLSLDRIDPDKNYCKENCRWIPLGEQQGTARRCRFIEWNGRRLTCAAWAREIGIHRDTILYRLDHGWRPEDILLSKPDHGSGWRHTKRIRAATIPCKECNKPSRCKSLCSIHYDRLRKRPHA